MKLHTVQCTVLALIIASVKSDPNSEPNETQNRRTRGIEYDFDTFINGWAPKFLDVTPMAWLNMLVRDRVMDDTPPGFRIIGGRPATGTGPPLSNKGRQGSIDAPSKLLKKRIVENDAKRTVITQRNEKLKQRKDGKDTTNESILKQLTILNEFLGWLLISEYYNMVNTKSNETEHRIKPSTVTPPLNTIERKVERLKKYPRPEYGQNSTKNDEVTHNLKPTVMKLNETVHNTLNWSQDKKPVTNVEDVPLPTFYERKNKTLSEENKRGNETLDSMESFEYF